MSRREGARCGAFHEPPIGGVELPLGPNIRAAQQRSPTARWFIAPMRLQTSKIEAPQ